MKTEEPSSPVGDVGSATSSATASATADSEPELKKPKMKAKHRLLIKIPRSAVTAATAHAAEVRVVGMCAVVPTSGVLKLIPWALAICAWCVYGGVLIQVSEEAWFHC